MALALLIMIIDSYDLLPFPFVILNLHRGRNRYRTAGHKRNASHGKTEGEEKAIVARDHGLGSKQRKLEAGGKRTNVIARTSHGAVVDGAKSCPTSALYIEISLCLSKHHAYGGYRSYCEFLMNTSLTSSVDQWPQRLERL